MEANKALEVNRALSLEALPVDSVVVTRNSYDEI
jgi:hypothetical protein